MNPIDKQLENMDDFSVNAIHDEAMIAAFRRGIGKRVFILTPSFPFMFVGKIKDVVEDMAVLDVETTSVAALEDSEWTVHIHNVEVFYIEKANGPKIPNLKEC